MKSIVAFPYRVSEDPHVLIPLSDGRKLSARIWRPEDAGPAPVILEYLPYRKRDSTAVRDALNHPWLPGTDMSPRGLILRAPAKARGCSTMNILSRSCPTALK